MRETVLDSRNPFRLNVRELYEYRELLYFFAWRDVKVKYKQTALGFLWAVLQPLLTALIFSAFFGKALNVPSDGVPYPLFVYSGMLAWNFFAAGLNNAVTGMIGHAGILKKIYFPRLLLPASAVLVAGFDCLMALIVGVGFWIYYQYTPNIINVLLFLPLGLGVTFMAAAGLGCLFGALTVKYRDFRYVVGFFSQALMFVTPVLYPASLLTSDWQKIIFGLNPMTAGVSLVRTAITGAPFNVSLVCTSALSTFVFFIIGVYIFRKSEAEFADWA